MHAGVHAMKRGLLQCHRQMGCFIILGHHGQLYNGKASTGCIFATKQSRSSDYGPYGLHQQTAHMFQAVCQACLEEVHTVLA